MIRRFAFVLPILLAGCGPREAGGADDADQQRDPAAVGALGDPVMTDPDLTGQNRGGAALAGGGPAVGEVPLIKRAAEEMAAARAEALKLAGGALARAPGPSQSEAASPAVLARNSAGVARTLPGLDAACIDKLDYSASWAARLPAALAIYPRAYVQEAAGSDRDGCTLRVVNYITPVAMADVIDLAYARARAAGLAVHRGQAGSDQVLRGGKGALAYVLYVRQRTDGLVEADLAVSGN